MLKTTDPSHRLPEPDEERPVGELVHELIEDGKAYARAEAGLAKSIAMAKVNALKAPAIMFFGALLLIQAAVTLLGVGIFVALAPLMGPLLAGLLVFLLLAGGAAALAWIAAKKIREAL